MNIPKSLQLTRRKAVRTLAFLAYAAVLALIDHYVLGNSLGFLPYLIGPAVVGTVSLEDLRANRLSSAAEYGLDTIQAALNRDLANTNTRIQDAISNLAAFTDDRQRVYGVGGQIIPTEVDEFGRARTKKDKADYTVGFPLRLYKSAVGWTTKFLEIATPAEIAEQYIRIRQGHVVKVGREIARALYINDNYSFTDNLVDDVVVPVKRLVNADSAAIPDSPGGATFDGATHDHYLARAGALANSDVDALVAHVTEHGHTRDVMIIINLADKSAIEALTGFVALGDGGIMYNATDVTVVKQDFSDLENQLIGYWRNTSVQIWVKPWAIDDYWLCFAGGGEEKLLAYRQRVQESLRGLRLVATLPNYPLVSDNFESEYGMGVWNRTAGAILYTGGTSWTDPTLP